MFTSKEHLHVNLGVEEGIAKFFVDRKIPANNRYWKGKYLYVASGTGYLFIPLFFDLQFKCGISGESVINEDYIQLMEAILNSAALHEFEEISFQEHLENCKILMTDRVKNYSLYNDLLIYFNDGQLKPYKNLGTSIKALNRGDTLLFNFCYYNPDKDIADKILAAWYALVPSFLLMDDISDLQDDKNKNEENSIDDFGQGREGIEKAIETLRNNFNLLKIYNYKLGMYFQDSLERKIQTPYLQSLLNRI